MSSTPDCPHEQMSEMVPCQVVSDTLSDYLEELLSDHQRIRLEEHLAACPLCLVYLDHFKAVYRLTGKVEPEQLPQDFDRVVGEAIRRWKAESEG